DNNLQLNLTTIITDFEQAAIYALSNTFPASQYETDIDLSLMLRCLLALAFLPHDEIFDAFKILKAEMQPAAADITQWFGNIYVHRNIRRLLTNGNKLHNSSFFPPELWSVYSSVENKEQQNVDCQIERILNEEPKPKPKKNTIEQEKRIMSVLNDQFNRTTIDFLKGIAHNLFF
ncbi:11105_t:CDS:2, partial [Cetraspora pellucida]